MDKEFRKPIQQGSEAWLQVRRKHAITWSRAGDAIGVGYNSRAKYMREKLGIDPEPEANWRMLEGNKREPWAAELYYRIMAFCGQDVDLLVEHFASDSADPRIGGSPDRIVTDRATGEKWLLEIKTQPGATEVRTEIPITHLLQMHGLCHTYGLPKAHYICWCQSKGIFIAEVLFHPNLWDFLYPRYKDFASLWAYGIVPGRMDSQEKQTIIDYVNSHVIVREIASVSDRVQRREHQERLASQRFLENDELQPESLL